MALTRGAIALGRRVGAEAEYIVADQAWCLVPLGREAVPFLVVPAVSTCTMDVRRRGQQGGATVEPA